MEQAHFPGWKPFMRSVRPRPTAYDDSVVKATTKEILKRLPRYGIAYSGDEEAVESIERAILVNSSGYNVCRDLEWDGWDMEDERVADVFMGTYSLRDRVLQEEIARWVEDTQAEPKFEIGQKVRFVAGKVVTEGVVFKIYRPQAQYGVRIDDTERVLRLVDYEKCEAVA